MTPVEVLAEASAAGLQVDLSDDGALLVRPRDKATADLVTKLRAHKPSLVEYLGRRARVMQQAADELRQCPELQRATKFDLDVDGATYMAGVAVRLSDGGVATAILVGIAANDPFSLFTAFDRACRSPVQ